MILVTVVSVFNIIIMLLLLWRKKNPLFSLVSPPILLSLFVLIYCVMGVKLFWSNGYNFLGKDYSESLDSIYYIITLYTVIFSLSFLVFKSFLPKNLNKPIFNAKLNFKPVWIYCSLLMILMLFLFVGINIAIPTNIFFTFFNSIVTIISFAVIARMRGSTLICLLLISIILYLGFRYRLIYLLFPILLYFFLLKAPILSKIYKWVFGISAVIMLIAVTGVARSYGNGLQLDSLAGLSISELLIKGIFNDTSTVLVSGAAIDYMVENDAYSYFSQIKYILSYFIPSNLWASKEYSPILLYIGRATGQYNNDAGAIGLGFVEYFHTAGVVGVVAFAMIHSYFGARIYNNMVLFKNNYHIFIYGAVVAWFINSLTRGYFPQNTHELLSLLIGIFFIKRYMKHNY